MDTATRILEAADTLFGERGFDAVSVRDVARRADVNKALVFYHFDNKQALFGRVLERYYEAHREALQPAFEQDLPLRDRLHRVVDAYVDFIAANQHYPRLVQRVVAGSGAPPEQVRRNLALLSETTEQALREVAPERGPLAPRHFFVTFSAAVINWFTYGPALAEGWSTDPLSDEAIGERREHLHWLVDTLLEGLEAADRRDT